MINLASPKYADFLSRFNHEAEFLEGTTQAGKTTVGSFKYILMVEKNPKPQHVLAALNKGVLEKNLINAENGLLDVFQGLGVPLDYYGNGRGNVTLPHLLLNGGTAREKVIYCLGYDDRNRWKTALGGQYGCLYIDEINTADIDFVREASMRCDYLMATLNPDDPTLQVYKEYINCSRPLEKWRDQTPKEILAELIEPAKPKWVHWFFNFDDNPTLTPEKKEQVIRNVPVGTKLYKNKIQGLRGKATGLVFSNFEEKKHVITDKWLKQKIQSREIRFKRFSVGLDTAYSAHTEDTISMELIGVTDDNTVIVLKEKVYNNRDLREPLAPSDTVLKLVEFLEAARKEFGLCRNVFIDSADQATLMQCRKYKRENGSMYQFNDSYKAVKIIDRINFKLGWLAEGKYLVHESCKEHIREMNAYSWKDDKDEPEDRNNHTIDAVDYAWLPFRREIGVNMEED